MDDHGFPKLARRFNVELSDHAAFPLIATEHKKLAYQRGNVLWVTSGRYEIIGRELNVHLGCAPEPTFTWSLRDVDVIRDPHTNLALDNPKLILEELDRHCDEISRDVSRRN